MSKAKFKERELTIEDAISEAYGELEALAGEMRDAFDNTPESLQDSSVGSARGEAADALENISEPTVPDELKGDKFKVKWQVRILSPSASRKQSRASRRDEVVLMLTVVTEYLGAIEEGSSGNYTDEEKQAASDLVTEVDQMIDEAENVEFPGMYG